MHRTPKTDRRWSPLKVRPRPNYSESPSKRIDKGQGANGRLYSLPISSNPNDIDLVFDSRPGNFVHCHDLHIGAYSAMVAVRDLDWAWAQGRSAGRAVCLKIYQKSDILRDDALRRRILREVDAHKVIFAGMQRRNIETFVLRIEASLVDASRVFLATELMSRNLLQEIAENVLEKDTIRKWIAQIDLGLFVIHHRKIIHGAIRPESILVGFDGNVKITDLSASLPASSFTNRMHEKPQWPYSAPETWNRTPGTIVTKAIDYWGLGVIVVGLEAERKHTRWVFDVNYGEAFRRWYDTAYPTFPGLDDEATALVSGLLNSYPELRFGHLQVKKQRYFGTSNRDNKYAEIEAWKPKDPPYIPLESKAPHPEKYLPTDKIEDHKDCDVRFKPFCWINNKGVWGKSVKGHGEIMYSSR